MSARVTYAPPSAAERLPNGLRVLAVRLPTVPRVEVRLRVPFDAAEPEPAAGPELTYGPELAARGAVLASTVLRGLPHTNRRGIETALGRFGGELVPLFAARQFSLRGGVLAAGLVPLLRLLADTLTSATHPEEEVRAARASLGGQLAVARSAPATAARALMLRQAYGDHPAGRELPAPDEVAAVTPGQVRTLHERQLVPGRAALVLVGDLDPDETVEAARDALARWTGHSPAADALTPPEFPAGEVRPHPAPGEATAQIRLCAPAGADPADPALRLAVLALGGFASSRLTARLRTRHGYTYAVRSALESGPCGQRLVVEADTAPPTALPLLTALGAELARMTQVPPDAAEVATARAHMTGGSLIAWSTQAGLADALADPAVSVADPRELHTRLDVLDRTPVAAVATAARDFFSPARFTGVLTGAPGTPPPSCPHWRLAPARKP